MKIYASKLAQKTLRKKVIDPLAGGPRRISKLAEIEANAIDFADKILMDLDLPSSPTLVLGALKGFEDVNVDFKDTVGIITVYASFHSLSGKKIRMDLPIPISRGHFHRPSIAVINGKRCVFSQALVDKLLDRVETEKPQTLEPFSPNRRIQREEVVNNGLFQVPEADNNYMDLVVNRYRNS